MRARWSGRSCVSSGCQHRGHRPTTTMKTLPRAVLRMMAVLWMVIFRSQRLCAMTSSVPPQVVKMQRSFLVDDDRVLVFTEALMHVSRAPEVTAPTGKDSWHLLECLVWECKAWPAPCPGKNCTGATVLPSDAKNLEVAEGLVPGAFGRSFPYLWVLSHLPPSPTSAGMLRNICKIKRPVGWPFSSASVFMERSNQTVVVKLRCREQNRKLRASPTPNGLKPDHGHSAKVLRGFLR